MEAPASYRRGFPATVATCVSRERLGFAGFLRFAGAAAGLQHRSAHARRRATTLFCSCSINNSSGQFCPWGDQISFVSFISRRSLPKRIGMEPGVILVQSSSVPGVWLCGWETAHADGCGSDDEPAENHREGSCRCGHATIGRRHSLPCRRGSRRRSEARGEG
jgi:hypothetical protein